MKSRVPLRGVQEGGTMHDLSGLLSQVQTEAEINRLLAKKETFAAICLDIDDLQTSNVTYGYDKGDQIIKLIAGVARDTVTRYGNRGDRVGHLGGDNIVVLTTVHKARPLSRRIIAEFDVQKKGLFSDNDLNTERDMQPGPFREEESPAVTASSVVITNEKWPFQNYHEFTDAAAEQLAFIKRSAARSPLAKGNGKAKTGHKTAAIPSRSTSEEPKIIQGAWDWLNRIVQEIDDQVLNLSDTFTDLKPKIGKNDPDEHARLGGVMCDCISGISHIVHGINGVMSMEFPPVKNVPEEIVLADYLKWVKEQVKGETGQRKISIHIRGQAGAGNLIIDGRGLAQCLLLLVQTEVQASKTRDTLSVSVSATDGEIVTIKISHPSRRVPQEVLDRVLQGRWGDGTDISFASRAYLAKLLVQGLNGTLTLSDDESLGLTYTICLPRRWQSWMQEVNSLLLGLDINRKQARNVLQQLEYQVDSLSGGLPPEIYKNFKALSLRLQELGVICNRSLYLVEDYNAKLEAMQDSWLRQEMEQLVTVEALVTLLAQIARYSGETQLFDLETGRRVARNALAIAGEYPLLLGEHQALHYAALLKDLGLVPRVASFRKDGASSFRTNFQQVWNALSTVPFLRSSLRLIMSSYERYDGAGAVLTPEGPKSPVAAGVLTVARDFDTLTSGLSPEGTNEPQQAVQKMVEGAGSLYDPEAINAFLQVWTRQGLGVAPRESVIEEPGT